MKTTNKGKAQMGRPGLKKKSIKFQIKTHYKVTINNSNKKIFKENSINFFSIANNMR